MQSNLIHASQSNIVSNLAISNPIDVTFNLFRDLYNPHIDTSGKIGRRYFLFVCPKLPKMDQKLFGIPKDPRNTHEIPAKVALKGTKKLQLHNKRATH